MKLLSILLTQLKIQQPLRIYPLYLLLTYLRDTDIMKPVIQKQIIKLTLIIVASFALFACQAVHTSLEKADLDVQTKASASIFLEPVSPAKRIIFVSVRNTSDRDLNIKSRIVDRLSNSGYRITDDPDAAHFMLQANVLKVGKDNLGSTDSYLDAGFSGAVLGSAVSSDSDNT